MYKMIDNFILNTLLSSPEKHYELYSAKKKSSNDRAVVKAIKLTRFMNDHSLRDQVINELHILKRLDHPGICRLFKMLKSSNNIYLIYEALPQDRLSDLILANALASSALITRFLYSLLNTLDYLHGQGVIHNNVNVSSIFYDRQNQEIKLRNFKNAYVIGETGKDHRIYMPSCLEYADPEIVTRQTRSVQSDVFSVGCVLYEVLAGEKLFSFQENQVDQSQYSQESIDSRVDQLTGDALLIQLVRQALEVDASRRITVQQMMNMLDQGGNDIFGQIQPVSNDVSPSFKRPVDNDKINSEIIGIRKKIFVLNSMQDSVMEQSSERTEIESMVIMELQSAHYTLLHSLVNDREALSGHLGSLGISMADSQLNNYLESRVFRQLQARQNSDMLSFQSIYKEYFCLMAERFQRDREHYAALLPELPVSADTLFHQSSERLSSREQHTLLSYLDHPLLNSLL